MDKVPFDQAQVLQDVVGVPDPGEAVLDGGVGVLSLQPGSGGGGLTRGRGKQGQALAPCSGQGDPQAAEVVLTRAVAELTRGREMASRRPARSPSDCTRQRTVGLGEVGVDVNPGYTE